MQLTLEVDVPNAMCQTLPKRQTDKRKKDKRICLLSVCL